MKRLLLTILLLIPLLASSQKIKTNETDEFTGKTVIETSWDMIAILKYNFFSRVSQIDDTRFLEIKCQTGICTVREDHDLMLKLDNGEVITLNPISSEVSCRGCGAKGLSGSEMYGVQLSFVLSPVQYTQLMTRKLVKIRLYTNDGYCESKVPSARAPKLQKQLKLVQAAQR